MSAYNWIVLDAICPACGQKSTIRCQTHIASDYGGDDRGRFHDREYLLGEELRWWGKDDPKYPRWRIDGKSDRKLPDYAEEACYSTCDSCDSNLCSVILFHQTVPKKIVQLTKEEDWPDGYKK